MWKTRDLGDALLEALRLGGEVWADYDVPADAWGHSAEYHVLKTGEKPEPHWACIHQGKREVQR